MAFVKVPTRTATTKDPRVFTVPGLDKPVMITLDDDGECKGIAIGAGKFAELRIPARMFGALLRPDAVKLAEAASDAVDKARAAGKYEADDSRGYRSWIYKG